VPLGPVFANVVLHAGSSAFGVLLTAYGVGVGLGIVGVGLVQRWLPHRRMFVWSALAGGLFLIAASAVDTLSQSSLIIVGRGMVAETAGTSAGARWDGRRNGRVLGRRGVAWSTALVVRWPANATGQRTATARLAE
jgi:hypothetical protein